MYLPNISPDVKMRNGTFGANALRKSPVDSTSPPEIMIFLKVTRSAMTYMTVAAERTVTHS